MAVPSREPEGSQSAMHRSLPWDPRIVQVSIEALPFSSHIYYPDLLNSTLLSQDCMVGAGSSKQNAHSKSTGGVRSL